MKRLALIVMVLVCTARLVADQSIALPDVRVVGASARILAFPATAAFTDIGILRDRIVLHVEPTQAWPMVPVGDSEPAQAGTLWVFLKIGGVWHATGAERLRPEQLHGPKPEGGPGSLIGDDWLFDPNRWGVMAGYNPEPGELVGFMVAAGSTRSDDNTPVEERTPVVLFHWPGTNGVEHAEMVWTEGVAAPEPGQPPVVSPGDIDSLVDLLADIQQQVASLRTYIEEQAAQLHAEHAQQGDAIENKKGGSGFWGMFLAALAAVATGLGASKQ